MRRCRTRRGTRVGAETTPAEETRFRAPAGLEPSWEDGEISLGSEDSRRTGDKCPPPPTAHVFTLKADVRGLSLPFDPG